MKYFVLPTCNIAFNAKVGSSSLACAAVKKFYPDRLKKVLEDYEKTWSQFSQEFKDSLPESFQKMFRNDKLDSVSFWQNICPITNNPVGKTLLAFREPVTRFASTVAYLEMDAEKTITILENDECAVVDKASVKLRTNVHFAPQFPLINSETTIYKFPDRLKDMCLDADLDWPMETVNEGKNKKPVLTDKQIERIKAFYAEDVKIFSSL